MSLSIDSNGSFAASDIQVAVSYDACIAWARIAKLHGEEAKAALQVRRMAWSEDGDPDIRGESLRVEFFASVQAIVAAATSLDGLYGQLIQMGVVPNELRSIWRSKKTPRPSQVSETIRLAFGVGQKPFAEMRENIAAIYKLRDLAVHPSASKSKPCRHPEAEVALEWRFTVFRGDVADAMVNYTLSLLWEISRAKDAQPEKITEFVEQLVKHLEFLLPDGKPTPPSESVSFTIPSGL